MKAARRLTIATAAFVVLAACKTPIDSTGPESVIVDSTIVFAINGSAPGSPTALDLFNVTTFRANQAFAYDLAFDINAEGQPVVIPAAALATNYSVPHDVGVQVVPAATFGSLAFAPASGYRCEGSVAVHLASKSASAGLTWLFARRSQRSGD